MTPEIFHIEISGHLRNDDQQGKYCADIQTLKLGLKKHPPKRSTISC